MVLIVQVCIHACLYPRLVVFCIINVAVLVQQHSNFQHLHVLKQTMKKMFDLSFEFLKDTGTEMVALIRVLMGLVVQPLIIVGLLHILTVIVINVHASLDSKY